MNSGNNQVAFVTGAARRIGASIVRELHKAGYKVAIHCNQSLQDALLLSVELNALRPESAMILQADFNTQPVKNLVEQVVAWGGRLDVLVNNASIFVRDTAANMDWDALFHLNVKTPYDLSQAANPHLALHQGVIINITDIHAETPLKGYNVYCQTKAALAAQTKALARAFAPAVRVNAIAPGAIAWPEQQNALSLSLQEKIITETPLKRHGSPEFISQALLALVKNPFITGQILKVDGGRSL